MNKILTMETKSVRTVSLWIGVVVAMVALTFVGVRFAEAAITSQMDLGDRGADVTELQTYLATNSTIYPEGLVTGYYGQLTKAAVERFQTSQGIVSQGTPATTGYGRVGPQTMAAINSRLATGDRNAPLITSVNVNTGSTGAVVNWSASEMARAKVYYSTSPIRISNVFDVNGVFSGEPTVTGTLAPYDGISRSAQSVSIGSLVPNTTYYYLVALLDSSNNVSISLPASFSTTQ